MFIDNVDCLELLRPGSLGPPKFTLRSYGAGQHFVESRAINISLLTERNQ